MEIEPLGTDEVEFKISTDVVELLESDSGPAVLSGLAVPPLGPVGILNPGVE